MMLDRDKLKEAIAQVGGPAGTSWGGDHFLVRQEVIEAARLVADEDTLVISKVDGEWPIEVSLASRMAVERVGLVGFVDVFLATLLELQLAAEVGSGTQ
jgi:hypothetical protein